MNLSKNRITMLAIAAVALVVVVVVAVMALGSLGTRSENMESREYGEATIRKFAKAKIAPTESAVSAITSNTVLLSSWYEIAAESVSKGDFRAAKDVNEAAFKQQMIDEARELSKLPGAVNGAIVPSGFTFGFDKYIGGGELPDKSVIAELQHQWHDIKIFVSLLAESKIEEIKKVQVISKPAPVEAAVKPARGSKKNAEAEKPLCKQERYIVEFTARPGALVAALNAFATAQRFIIVDSVEFFRENDMIGTAIGSSDKKAESASAKRPRRSRRGREESSDEKAEVKKSGFVTEPTKENPIYVRLSLVTCDFGSRGEAPVESNQKEQE